MRIHTFIVIILCLFYTAAAGQVSDSLYNALPINARPADKNNLTVKESQAVLLATDMFDAFRHIPELRVIANNLQKKVSVSSVAGKINYLLAIASFYGNVGNDSAVNYCKQVIALAGTDTQYSKMVIRACHIKSDIYYYNERYDSCINILHEILNIAYAIKDTSSIIRALNEYGGIYTDIGLTNDGIYYQREAVRLGEKASFSPVEMVQYRLSLAGLYALGYKETGERLYKDSCNIIVHTIMAAKKNEAARWFRQCYYLAGYIEYLDGNYPKAISLFDSCILPAYNKESLFGKNNSFDPYMYRAVCIIKTGRYAEGKRILDSLNADISTATYFYKQVAYKALSEAEEATGNAAGALLYYKKFKLSSDSLNLHSQVGQVLEAERKFQVAQREGSIKGLENKNLQQKFTILLWVAGFLCAAIALFIVLLYYRGKLAKRKNEAQQLTGRLQLMEEEMRLDKARQVAENEEALTTQRESISRNMHDEISSSIAAVCFLIKNIQANAKTGEARDLLKNISVEVDSLYIQARDFMHRLYGNADVIEYHLADLLYSLAITFNQGSSLRILTEYNEKDIERYFTEKHHLETYLFVKESVTNCMKHSGASVLTIKVLYNSGFFFITIADNGKGLPGDGPGMGLHSMQERIKALNGEVSFTNKNGLVIAAEFPV